MQAKSEMEAIKNLSEKVAEIVESGSNDNGSYIKFADGTMICILEIEVSDQAINLQYGDTALYTGRRTWTFPAAFTQKPSVTCSQFHWGTSGSWGGVSGKSLVNTSLVGYDFYQRATGTNVEISAIAIGRWK
jgi:hypothetical protein